MRNGASMDSPSSSLNVSWRKPARCNGSAACVEVAAIAGGLMGVRDSESAGDVLLFTAPEWRMFREQVKAGIHDLPR